jgi:ABC-type nitrate/sulfonate/bicarbonate transport system ATPase subunit
LETIDAGTISFGQDTRAEDVRVMFQEPRLLPWARILSNVEVGLGRDRALPDAGACRKGAFRSRALKTSAVSGRRCCPADRSSASR